MSKADFTGLRIQLAQRVPTPPWATVTRAAQGPPPSPKNKRWAIAGAAIAMVALLVSSFALAKVTKYSDQAAAQRRAANAGLYTEAVLMDRDHAFALIGMCGYTPPLDAPTRAVRPKSGTCATVVGATGIRKNGGFSWERVELPQEVVEFLSATKDVPIQVVLKPFGPKALALLVNDATGSNNDSILVVSTDAGRTWRKPGPQAGFAALPADGGILPCEFEVRPVAQRQPYRCSMPVGDPETGRLGILVHAPVGLHLDQSTGDYLWARPQTGDGKDNLVTVAVSKDRGKTWTVRPVGDDPKNMVSGVAASADGRVAYATSTQPNGGETSLFRTNDSGQSWRRVGPAPGAVVAVLPDGSLLCQSSGGGKGGPKEPTFYRSADGGINFTADNAAFLGTFTASVRPLPNGGFVSYVTEGNGQPGMGSSADGLTWESIPMPQHDKVK